MKLVFVLVLFVLFSIPVLAQKKSSVWEINQMKVKDSTELEDFVEYWRLNYGRAREEGIRQGLVVSYKILQKANLDKKTPWDILLMTEYKDTAKMHQFEREYNAILKKIGGGVNVKGKSVMDFGIPMGYMVIKEVQ